MQFVDEDNRLAFVPGQVFQHVLESLLELAPKLRARQQGRHVQRQHAFALERLRHLARHDALRQPFHNRRLADTRLADQHRVVLGPALQHLDGAADFVIAADHRVQFAHAGTFGQVDAILLERLALVFGVGAIHVLPTAHCVDGALQRLAQQAVVTDHLANICFAVCQRQQKQLTGDELVTALDRLLFRRLQQTHHVAANLHLHLLLAVHGRQFCNRRLACRQQTVDVHAGALQQRPGPVVLLEHRHQHMAGFDIGVVLGQGQGLGFAQGLLKFGGEFVDTHGWVLRIASHLG